jgi:uncharacterized protein YdaU (DUF1376 family)
VNYYPFHIGDYVSATRHLSWEEDCAYRRLLDTYYTSEKPLPPDQRAVCRLVLATTDAQREAVRVVLEEFFESTPDGWINSRADTEIAAMQEKQQKQRDKANKRWQMHKPEPGIAPALPQHPSGNAAALKSDADAMPPTPTPTPKKPPSGVAGGTPPKPPAFEVPSWMPQSEWADFVEMRRAKGKRSPFTVAAAKGIVGELTRLREQGQDVASVLRQSVVNGWSGVFPVKAEKSAPAANGDWTRNAA